MVVKKLSVALDAVVASAAATEAEREGISLSAWLTRAAKEALAIERGLAAVRSYEAEHGRFGEEAVAWADAAVERTLGPLAGERQR